MLTDRYENPLSTTSPAARDAYIEAVDLFLSANTGADKAFTRAIGNDENFALAYVGLARHYHINGNPKAAKQSLAAAQART